MDYWRATDRERRYPTEFVRALTEAGWLSCLIPEEYGGAGFKLAPAAGVLREKKPNGANSAPPPPQKYTMGGGVRPPTEAQKKKKLPKNPQRGLRPPALRR